MSREQSRTVRLACLGTSGAGNAEPQTLNFRLAQKETKETKKNIAPAAFVLFVTFYEHPCHPSSSVVQKLARLDKAPAWLENGPCKCR